MPWYRSLNRSQWNALLASNLGWLLDGYELYALILTVGLALHQLLDPSQYTQIPVYAGTVIATTLLGWGHVNHLLSKTSRAREGPKTSSGKILFSKNTPSPPCHWKYTFANAPKKMSGCNYRRGCGSFGRASTVST